MHRRLENSVGSRDLDLSTRKWDISYKREEKHFAKFEIYVCFFCTLGHGLAQDFSLGARTNGRRPRAGWVLGEGQ